MLKRIGGLFDFVKNNAIVIVIGIVGSAIVSASSAYAVLRLGNIVFPTAFACIFALLSTAILKNKSSQKAILIQSSMISATFAAIMLSAILPNAIGTGVNTEFKAPSFYLSQSLTGFEQYFTNRKIFIDSFSSVEQLQNQAHSLSQLKLPIIFIISASLILAILFSWILKNRYVNGKDFQFPLAEAQVKLLTQDNLLHSKNRKQKIYLFAAVGAVIAAVRTVVKQIPFAIEFKKIREKSNVDVGIALSPMIAGFGYIAGFKRAAAMLIGGLLASVVAVPILVKTGVAVDYETALNFRNQVGVGLLIGTGIGTFADLLLDKLEEIDGATEENNSFSIKKISVHKNYPILILFFVIAVVLISMSGVSVLVALTLIPVIYFLCYAFSMLSGKIGIFDCSAATLSSAAIVMTLCIVFDIAYSQTFLLIFLISVSCIACGELINSYKIGSISGVSSSNQLIMHIIGAVVGGLFALLCFFSLMESSKAICDNDVALKLLDMIGKNSNFAIIWLSAAFSAALVLLKLPAMSFTFGVLLPFSYSLCFFIGGAVRFLRQKTGKNTDFSGAAGLIAGESSAVSLVSLISWIAGV